MKWLSTLRRVLTALWRRPGYALVTSLLLGASSAALLVMLVVLDGLLIRAPSGQHIDELLFIRLPATQLDVPLLAPEPRDVVTAALLLTLTALAGLCAPLWQLRRLDILRTLQPS